MPEEKSLYALSEMERDVVIAALRMWQRAKWTEIPREIREIALNGRRDMLNDIEIDGLIQDRLNGPAVHLYYVQCDGENEGGNLDLFVSAKDEVEAEILWRDNYDLPYENEPDRTLRWVPTGQPGVIGWVETDPQLGGFFKEAA